MILLHIYTSTIEQAEEIGELLYSRKLILSPFIIEKSAKSNGNDYNYLVMSRTKALLFTKIDDLLLSNYHDRMPILYSLPIVHMDWEQSKELADSLESV